MISNSNSFGGPPPLVEVRIVPVLLRYEVFPKGNPLR